MEAELTPEKIFFLDPFPENKKIILLLHGLGSDSSSWQMQFDVLNQIGYRPIVIDLPGFGRSPFSRRHWKISTVSKIISRQILENLPQPVAIMGLSLGGVVEQELLRIKPEAFSKVILVSTFSRLRPSIKNNLPYLSRRFLLVVSGRLSTQAKTVADNIFPLEDQKLWHDYLIKQIEEANPKIYRQAMIALAEFNSRRWMKKISLPSLVISGSEDATVTLKEQRNLAKIIHDSNHLVISGGRHAVNIDHQIEFNAAIADFLSDI